MIYKACRSAQMAELVDALDSKSGFRKGVQVRFLFWAPHRNDEKIFYHSGFLFAVILCQSYRYTNLKNIRTPKDNKIEVLKVR